MDKAYIMKLSEKYRKKAADAYMNYQDTGISRYDRERRNAEDMADAFDMAVNAADEHAFCGHLKAEFLWLAGKAESAVMRNAPKDELVEILEEVVSSAVLHCNYARSETTFGGGARR